MRFLLNRFSLLIALVLFCAFQVNNTLAQTPLESAKAEQVLQQFGRAAAEMSSIQCRFTQTKSAKLLKEKMISEGRMLYRQPAELRWEYTKPNDFVFVVKNDRVTVSSEGKVRKFGGQRAKAFKQMTQMILGTITGQFFNDTRSFTTEVYEAGKNYTVHLLPQNKELKKLFVRFVLELTPALNMATAVEMYEKNGDVTRIEFSEVLLNQAIDEKEFKIE